MDENERAVLEGVARFGPLELQELKMLVPTLSEIEVEHTTETLKERGFITHKDADNREFNRFYDDDVIQINTNPFHTVSEGQQSLTGDSPTVQKQRESAIPRDIPQSAMIDLTLTEDQSRRFERMRADVSRTCGAMSREEFMSWVLDMASRFTEV